MSCCLKKAWKNLFSCIKKDKGSRTSSESSSQQDFRVLDRHSKFSFRGEPTINESENTPTTHNIHVHDPITVEIFDETSYETQSLDSCSECSSAFERSKEQTETSTDYFLLTNEDQRLETKEDHSLASSADSLYSDISDSLLSYSHDIREYSSSNDSFDIKEFHDDGTDNDESKEYEEIQHSVENLHITEDELSTIKGQRDHICKIHMPASEMDWTDRKYYSSYVPKPFGHARDNVSGLVTKRKWESIGPRTVMEKPIEKSRTSGSDLPFLMDFTPKNYIRETIRTKISDRTSNQFIPPIARVEPHLRSNATDPVELMEQKCTIRTKISDRTSNQFIPPIARVKPHLRSNATDPVELMEQKCTQDIFDLHNEYHTYVCFAGDDMPVFEVKFPKFSELNLTMPKWYHSEPEENDIALSEKDPLHSQYLGHSNEKAQPNFLSSENAYISSQLHHEKEKSKSCKNTKLTEDLLSQSSSCEDMRSKKNEEEQEKNSRKFADDCIQKRKTNDMLKEVVENQSPKEVFIQEKVPSSISSQEKHEIHEVNNEKIPLVKDHKHYSNGLLFSCNKSCITSSPKEDNQSSWKRQGSEIYKDQVNHDMDSLSTSDAPTSYTEPTCLYDHDGEICIMNNERYIKAYITSFKIQVFVNLKKREIAGMAVGCKVLWQGQTPIPISTTTDGQKVKFDAILWPDDNKFQALIIWDKIKPKYVMEPSTRSYIFLDSQVLTCKGFVNHNGIKQVTVCYDGKVIYAEILNSANFIDKKPNDFALLKSYLNISNTISCKVSKLMTGNNGQSLKYVCSSIWIGNCPTKEVQKRDFEKGKIYRRNPNHTFIADKVPCCMYVDLPCQLKSIGVNMVLEFKIGSSKVTLPLTCDKLYSGNGNYKVDSSQPLDAPVKAHVFRVSESMWRILMVQLEQTKLSEVTTFSHLPLLEAEANLSNKASITSHKSLPEEKPNKSLEYANNIQHSRVMHEESENRVESDSIEEKKEGHKLHHIAQSKTREMKIFQEKNQACTTKNVSTSKALSPKSEMQKPLASVNSIYTLQNSAKKTVESHKNTVQNKEISSKTFVPNYLNNVTGKLINIVGDYGILEVKNRHINGNGMAYASFHKSVAYANRWPLYRDMFLSEQLARLTSKEWHCNLVKNNWALGNIKITFRATIAWQGLKPTQQNLQFFRNLPSDSSSLYYQDYKINNDHNNDFFHSNVYSELQKQCKSSSPQPKVQGKRGSSKETDDIDDLESLTMDDMMDLLPTLASDPLKEIVDV